MNTLKTFLRCSTLSVASLVIFASLVLILGFNSTKYLYSETGLLENTQLLLLAVSFLFFVFAVFNPKPRKMIPLFFASMTYALFLRELEIRELFPNVPNWIEFLIDGDVKHCTNAVIIAIPLIIATINFKIYFKEALNFVFSTQFVYLILAFTLLWCGYFCEKKITNPQYAELGEEIFEMLGYMMYLMSASLAEYNTRRISD